MHIECSSEAAWPQHLLQALTSSCSEAPVLPTQAWMGLAAAIPSGLALTGSMPDELQLQWGTFAAQRGLHEPAYSCSGELSTGTIPAALQQSCAVAAASVLIGARMCTAAAAWRPALWWAAPRVGLGLLRAWQVEQRCQRALARACSRQSSAVADGGRPPPSCQGRRCRGLSHPDRAAQPPPTEAALPISRTCSWC